jgi:uncharacterized protein with von Willebrand factor type A (vWA) domain
VLAANVVNFARLLRAAGMPVGVDRGLAAIEAIGAVGVERREDVHAALSAVLVSRREQQPLFDAAFDTFWRDPKLLERMLVALLPKVSGRGQPPDTPKRPARLEAALRGAPPAPPPPSQPQDDEEHSIDAMLTWSDRERLQHRDFESMTPEEFQAACRLVQQVPLPVDPIRTRRWRRPVFHARAPVVPRPGAGPV